MNSRCISKIPTIEKVPIHFRFGTFLVVCGAIISIAVAVGGSYTMLQNHQKVLDERTPIINEIPVLKSQQAEIVKRLDKIDENVQTLTDYLIKKR